MEISPQAFQQAINGGDLVQFIKDWSQVPVYVPFINKQAEGLLLPAETDAPNRQAYIVYSTRELAEVGLGDFEAVPDVEVTIKSVPLGELARNAFVADMELVWFHDGAKGIIPLEVVELLGANAFIENEEGVELRYQFTAYFLENKEVIGKGPIVQAWVVTHPNTGDTAGEQAEFKVYDEREILLLSEGTDFRRRDSLAPREQALFDRWAVPTYADAIISYMAAQGHLPLTDAAEQEPVSANDIPASVLADDASASVAGPEGVTATDEERKTEAGNTGQQQAVTTPAEREPAQDVDTGPDATDNHGSREKVRGMSGKVVAGAFTLATVTGAAFYWFFPGVGV